MIGSQNILDPACQFLMFFRCHSAHNTGYALEHINGRIMIVLCHAPGQNDMSVQNTTGRIRDRFIEIITVHQYGVQPRDGALIGIPCPLKKFRHLGIDTGGIPPGYRRFPGGETNLPLCHTETGEVIHHQQHIFSLVTEIFRQCRGRLRRLAPDQGRLI